jgi:fatty-acyl-CoA synthase
VRGGFPDGGMALPFLEVAWEDVFVNVAMLLDMAAEGCGERVAFGPKAGGMTYQELADGARRTAEWIEGAGVERVGLVDTNSEAVPLLLFGAAVSGRPFVPVNYRLADEQLRAILARTAPAVAVVDDAVPTRVGDVDGVQMVPRKQFLGEVAELAGVDSSWSGDPEDIAVLLFTSGTTGEPKAAVLRHRHLVSYILTSVEFLGAGEEECALVSVPPYHIAGISAVLSSVYTGRRVVQLESFSPAGWVGLARREEVTHAMVVPTMLGRILDVIAADGGGLPALRHLSYGGGRMPVPVIERALELLPGVNFVNAYGLTETSSTIAVLGPDDHRDALAASEPAVRRRLGSVGRPLPALEVEIRDPDGVVCLPGVHGEIHVRGEQVAGEYLGRSNTLVDGWFPTNDGGYLDEGGFLFVEGRLDDVIVRGGENLSPGEIEEVLITHPAVADVAVVGVPDTEWGEKVAAAVVAVDGIEVTAASCRTGSAPGSVRRGLPNWSPSATSCLTTTPANCCAECSRPNSAASHRLLPAGTRWCPVD